VSTVGSEFAPSSKSASVGKDRNMHPSRNVIRLATSPYRRYRFETLDVAEEIGCSLEATKTGNA